MNREAMAKAQCLFLLLLVPVCVRANAGFQSDPFVPFFDAGCPGDSNSETGDCLSVTELFGPELSENDAASSVTCPTGQHVMFCECVITTPGTSGSYCDGVVIHDSGTRCEAKGAKDGGSHKAHVVCGIVTGTVTVRSNPESTNPRMTRTAPSVICQPGEVVLGCYAHTWFADNHGQPVTTMRGPYCMTMSTCTSCRVQAVCLAPGDETPAENCACLSHASGSYETVANAVSTATCPTGQIVTSCRCVSLTAGGRCNGVTISTDGTECSAHGAVTGEMIIARACCGSLAGTVHVVEAPTWPATAPGPSVSCDSGHDIIGCFSYSSERASYADDSPLQTTISGNTCSLQSTCANCHVQALCLERQCSTASVLEPGTIQFTSVSFTFDESVRPSAVLTLTRTGGADGAVGVDWATMDGTAINGMDYIDAFGTVYFLDGETEKTLEIIIIDDGEVDPAESFHVTLANPQGGAQIGVVNLATVMIEDNDTPVLEPGTIQFTSASFTFDESVGPAVLTLTRTGGADGAVGIDWATMDGTAINGMDYIDAFGTVYFLDGETEKTLEIMIIDDGTVDPGESFHVTLANPQGGAQIGVVNTATVMIEDNDNHGGWGAWSGYDTCSVTCGGGTQSESRQCDSPFPSVEGNPCTLLDGSFGFSETRTRQCNEQSCAASASAVDILAWDSGKISRISAEDGTVTPLMSADTFYSPHGLVRADVDDGFAFWSGLGNNRDLSRLAIDGSSVHTVIVPQTDIKEFDLDRENNKVYYLEEAGCKLKRIDYDGTNEQLLLNGGGLDCMDLFLDPIEQELYWKSNNIGSGFRKFKFNRCKVDGTGHEVWFEPDSGDYPPDHTDIYTALDYENRKMYWTSGSVRKVVDIDARSESDITPNPAPENKWEYISARKGKLYGWSKPTYNQYRIEMYDPETQTLTTLFTNPFDVFYSKKRFSTILTPSETPPVDATVSAVCDELYDAGQTLGYTKVIKEGNCQQVCTDNGGLTCRTSVKTYKKLPYHVYNGKCLTIYANGCCCNAANAASP